MSGDWSAYRGSTDEGAESGTHINMQPDEGFEPCPAGVATVESLYRRHHDDLLAWVRARFGPDLAEDVVATVFLKLQQGHLPDPAREPWPWLRRIAINAAVDLVRAQRTREPLHLDLVGLEADFSDAADQRIDLHTALATLTSVERDAVMAFTDGRTPEQVGHKHGRSAQAVKSVAKRVRRRLRVLLDPAIIPAYALVAWLRRKLQLAGGHGRASTEVAWIASCALVVALGPVGGVFGPPALAQSAQPLAARPTVALAVPVGREGRISVEPTKAPPSNVQPSSQPQPEDPVVEVEHEDGAATPRTIVIQQPTIDTPVGEQGGGRTELGCAGPEFSTLPRTEYLSRQC